MQPLSRLRTQTGLGHERLEIFEDPLNAGADIGGPTRHYTFSNRA